MNIPDPDDRLGLQRFDTVDAPDQWADIVRRAESVDGAATNIVEMPRRRTWYLAAAASLVALVGGLVIVAQARNDDGSTPIDQPPIATADATECASDSDLDAIAELLSSVVLLTYDLQPPAGDLDALIARNDVVVRGDITGVARTDDTGPIGYASISIASPSVLVGETAGVIDGFAMSSLWWEGAGPDPLAEPVAFDGLGVIAFLSADDDAPFGWTPDIEGLIVACGSGPATGLIQPAPFLDLTSLDALEAQITGAVDETIDTTQPRRPEPSTTPPTATPVTTPNTEGDDTLSESATDDRWTPACVERFGAGLPAPADTGLGEFGPLGVVPGLDIAVPSYRSPAHAEAVVPNVQVARVDGGVVIIARPFDGQDTDAHVLSVVDDDGSVRWRRCGSVFAGTLMTAPGAGEVTVEEYPPPGVSGSERLRTFDLATGEDREPVAVPKGLDVRTSDGSFTVFGPSDDRIPTADDRLAVIDHRSGQVHEIPYPADPAVPAFRHELQVIDDGSGEFRVLQRVEGPQSAVRNVWADGAWHADEATILDAAGITAVNTLDHGWEGRNGLGEVVWTRPDLLDLGREGFRSAESGTTTLINACLERAEFGCDRGSLFGIDTATGETRWERTALRGVAAVGDGVAIITNDAGAGWEMIDTLTGDLLDESQRWDGIELFEQQCCGGGEYVWVGRDGGVVFAVNSDRIRVWYPSDRTDATIDTSLMD